jgi:hypothetical protein
MKCLMLAFLGTAFLIGCPMQPSDDLATEEFDDLREIIISETESSSVNLGVSETVLVVDRDTSLRLQALPSGCRTIVAGAETDTDQDGIVDDVTYQYDPSKCVRNIPNGSRTFSGRIRIEDIASNPAIGYRIGYLEFAVTEKRFGVVVLTETRNGTRGASLSANKLILTRDNNINLKLERPSRLVQTLTNQMAFVFVASTPIAPNATLPAGSIALNGTVQWSRGTFAPRIYSTTTETALQTDPSCSNQRVVGGVQVLTRGKLTLRFAYQPCGTAPSVIKTLAP